jgi:hypothetical protein
MTRKHIQRKNNQWSSAAARRLLEMAGNPSTIEEAIRIVIKDVLEGIPCPPTNLEAIAERLGVSEIVGEDLPVSGELRRDGKKLKVVYSTYLSQTRKQFTIAHELGHAIFERTGARPPRAGEELERLCDMIASEILMPQDVLLSFANSEPSLSQLLETSQIFRTSLLATSIRYAKLKKVSIFFVEKNNIAWGCGIIKKGTLTSLDYNLKTAINEIVNNQIASHIFTLSHRQWSGEWKLDYQPLGQEKNALFMLRPILQKSWSASTQY